MSGKEYIKDPYLFLHPVNKIGEPSAVLLNKECFEKIGFFNTKLKQALDIEYWYRILPHFNIGFVDEELIKFRLHSGQASQINERTGVNEKRLLNDYGLNIYFGIYRPALKCNYYERFGIIKCRNILRKIEREIKILKFLKIKSF